MREARSLDQPQAAGQTPLLARVLLGIYRGAVSPALHAWSGSSCRYLPTCSEYAYVATSRFGMIRGGWMTAKRILRCHPFAKGGLDPVPGAPAEAKHLP